ncbi:MAG: TIR domain-containing protein [Pseudomonadota bacterium]
MKDQNVFISYSHKDLAWAKLLAEEPISTTSGRAVTAIDFRVLLPGDHFDEKLEAQVKAADLVVCLVSSDFLKSEYIKAKEINWMLQSPQGGKQIVWVPLGAPGRARLSPEEQAIWADLQTRHYDIKLPRHPPVGNDRAAAELIQRLSGTILRRLDPIGTELQKRLKDFRDLTFVAQSEFAKVYSAVGCATGIKVAIKTPATSDMRTGFRRSLQRASALSSIPNIVSVYQAVDDKDPPFCMMGFIEGPTLAQCIEDHHRERKRIDFASIRHVLLKLALALRAAHLRELPHLNLTASNVMLGEHWEPHLTPMPRLPSEDLQGDEEYERYTAPERRKGQGWEPESADIFALGRLGLEMLAAGASEVAPQELGQAGDGCSIRALRPECPVSLERAVEQMRAEDPEQRARSLDVALSALMWFPDAKLGKVELSWARCRARSQSGAADAPRFFEKFYDEFFESQPEAKELFANRKDPRQSRRMDLLVSDAVRHLFIYYDINARLGGVPDELNPLAGQARSHVRMGAKPSFFDAFSRALIDTVRLFDPEIAEGDTNSPILEAWEDVLKPGTNYMYRTARPNQQCTPLPDTPAPGEKAELPRESTRH